jgi:hypothetical protein
MRTGTSDGSAASSSTSSPLSTKRWRAPTVSGTPAARHFTCTVRSGSTTMSVAAFRSSRFRALRPAAAMATRIVAGSIASTSRYEQSIGCGRVLASSVTSGSAR